ncbi:hypothetical protein L3N51_01729 [Metallosphaera sp. J1]|uniref:damage-inducible protein CinA n=1 Tax=Metallosphaera javensis (ex Hofmann et al. 2022) TaxID=99938 RepID=UPI001EE0B886|nr:damage-inducible protein CinA [Metallosphaera javensis (ex Hofmann et al. 2022)]MCG3109437.1 hypothetical protein [Metallosphaera javensis (ex Hofmann et al. 2022)]
MYEVKHVVSDLFSEAQRQYTICNACRHCEGFCPVWDTISLRTLISENDIRYFAYLCHDCRDCFYACPYSVPHEFSLNIPKVNSQVRSTIHKSVVNSNLFSKITSNITTISIVIAAIVFVINALFIYIYEGSSALFGTKTTFYEVIPDIYIKIIGLALGIYALAFMIGLGIKYWKSIGEDLNDLFKLKIHLSTFSEEVAHKWFRGGGVGCDYPNSKGSISRMLAHSLLVGGFVLDFIATVIASIYQNILHVNPPYPVSSPVVITGVVGGLLILLSVFSLIILKNKSNKMLIDREMISMDGWLLYILLFISITGLLLLLLRNQPFMGVLLILHLSITVPLFVLAPFSKLTHIVYRYLATYKYNIEKNSVFISYKKGKGDYR